MKEWPSFLAILVEFRLVLIRNLIFGQAKSGCATLKPDALCCGWPYYAQGVSSINGAAMAALTRMVKRYPLAAFFTLAFCLTWANWFPQALASRGLLSISVPDFLTVISGYGPALAAIIVTALTTGKLGFRRLFGRLARWRVGLHWYAIVLLTPICITLTAVGLHLLTGGTAPNFTQPQLQCGRVQPG
jgi:hypothetical protein